ncbi:MAG: transaldolase, partial [Thermoanaerobaculia bacterium]|nr:transaldolase [Thermoanaerobaculia bacterium]
PRTPAIRAAVEGLREVLGRATGLAISVGFGPRYLHSTGQLFKGGPTGRYLFLYRSDAPELPIPGGDTTFGALQLAQARGDMAVLAARGRRLAAVDLAGDVEGGLEHLRAELAAALG